MTAHSGLMVLSLQSLFSVKSRVRMRECAWALTGASALMALQGLTVKQVLCICDPSNNSSY